jgi:hypothetical protein
MCANDVWVSRKFDDPGWVLLIGFEKNLLLGFWSTQAAIFSPVQYLGRHSSTYEYKELVGRFLLCLLGEVESLLEAVGI